MAASLPHENRSFLCWQKGLSVFPIPLRFRAITAIPAIQQG